MGTPETPPLPPEMPFWEVRRSNGETAIVVTPKDAAKLAGVSINAMQSWMAEGRVRICYTPYFQPRVFVDALWDVIPEIVRK